MFALIFIILACFINSIFDGIITGAAKSNAALTQSNQDDWAGIPGKYDIELDWVFSFFEPSNVDDVSSVYASN